MDSRLKRRFWNRFESDDDIGNVDFNTDDGNFNISVEGEDGEDNNITAGGDDENFSMTVEGEDGATFSLGGGEIPDGMLLPIADGGEVGSVLTSNDDTIVSLVYPGAEFDQLVSFYDSELDADSNEVTRFESSYESGDDTIRSVSWTPDSGDWSVSASDCIEGQTGELDSVCVTLYELNS